MSFIQGTEIILVLVLFWLFLFLVNQIKLVKFTVFVLWKKNLQYGPIVLTTQNTVDRRWNFWLQPPGRQEK